MGNEADANKEEADPTAGDAEGGSVRELVEGAALDLPGLAETDVGEANTAPDEEKGKTGERK